MDEGLSKWTRIEVLEKLRRRYGTAGAEHKRKLLDEAVQLLGYHRKAAIRTLRRRVVERGPLILTGRPVKYEPSLLVPWLRHYGLLANHRRTHRVALARLALEQSPLRFTAKTPPPPATAAPFTLTCPHCQATTPLSSALPKVPPPPLGPPPPDYFSYSPRPVSSSFVQHAR